MEIVYEAALCILTSDIDQPNRSSVLMVKDENDKWSLPTKLVSYYESSTDAAYSLLKEYLGIDPGVWIILKMTSVSDWPHRHRPNDDETTRLITATHSAMIPGTTNIEKDDAQWIQIMDLMDDNPNKVAMDHLRIIRTAGQNL